MRLPLSATALAGALVLACGPATPAPGTATPTASASVAAAPPPTAAPQAAGALPTKLECDAFMDVVARMTTLRASIHREPSTAAKAEDWAARTTRLAGEAKTLPLTQHDLVIEGENLATRMTDLAADLRALAAAEKSGNPTRMSAAHKKVITTSEQVEVITREPAARCAGDTRKLLTTAGRLSAGEIQRGIRTRLPLARKCYEEALTRDPRLTGRVIVRFVIGLDGKVQSAALAGPEEGLHADAVTPGETNVPLLKDAKVTACVLDVFRGTTFAPPDGGTVTVVYPITFAPSD